MQPLESVLQQKPQPEKKKIKHISQFKKLIFQFFSHFDQLNEIQKLIDLPIKSIGAPHKLINTFMHSVCPLDAAQCNAVNPSLYK